MLDARPWGFSSSKFDIQAAISEPTRDFLSAAALKDYVLKYLDPRVVTEQDVMDTVLTFYKDEISGVAENRPGSP